MADKKLTIYSPYEKIQNFWGEEYVVDIPNKVRDYLLLLPTKDCPNPIITNDNPRARLCKYIWYDDPNPLTKEMPSVSDRLNLIFNPNAPDKPPIPEKGFRVFTLSNIAQANIIGQTFIRIFMGAGTAVDPYTIRYQVTFHLLSNYSLEANTRTTVLSRTFAMEQAVIQALNGVNMMGVGTFMYSGSKPISDDQELIGRMLTMSVETKVLSNGSDTLSY